MTCTPTGGSALTGGPDKWAILRALTEARNHFHVSDRDLGVLTALLSCHAGPSIDPGGNTVVFASNQTLSARAHGMPESTLRRHLAALVKAGLIERRDSANGKRYARMSRAGALERAFGFDILPLLLRSSEIFAAAEAERDEREALRARREDLVLRLRDAALVQPESETALAELRRLLRRIPCPALLDEVARKLDALCPPDELSGSDGQNERHNNIQHKESYDSTCDEDLHLAAVVEHCASLESLGQPVNCWEDLLRTGQMLQPYLGIPERVWARSCQILGRYQASALLAYLHERCAGLRNPAGYLVKLTLELSEGRLSLARLFRPRRALS